MEKTLPDYPRGLNFEQVWAALMENREQIRETERFFKESQERYEREKQERREADERYARERREADERYARERRELEAQRVQERRELEAQMKETDKKISKLGNRFGEVIEHMVRPNLVAKFRELGFVFTKAYPEASIKDEKNNILAEIDITLENGDKVMIVEVKSKPSIDDVKEHIDRMKTVRRHADLHGDRRKFLGSVAGMVISDNVRDFALKTGFFVIVPSGDTFTITEPPDGHAREW